MLFELTLASLRQRILKLTCAIFPGDSLSRPAAIRRVHAAGPRPDAPSSSDTGAPPSAFDPAEALQNLHGLVIQLEAMAHAASEAVTHLPFPSGREDRRIFERVYTLVTKVADETDAVIRYGDEQISALAAHLQHRRAEANGAPVERS